MIAVAATVVESARIPLREPAISPSSVASPSDSAFSPNTWPNPNASSTPSTAATACRRPRFTDPKIVACTVSSAAQGARNGWATCRIRADTSQAITAARAVFTTWET